MVRAVDTGGIVYRVRIEAYAMQRRLNPTGLRKTEICAFANDARFEV